MTSVDSSGSSLAGGVVYMCQVAGGSVGLGISTAIVASAGTGALQFVSGVTDAFTFDLVMAFAATVVAFFGLTSRAATTQIQVAA